MKRIERPEKNWKFSIPDVQEREHFRDYMDAYVAAAVVDALEELQLEYPKVDAARREQLQLARAALLGGDGATRTSKPEVAGTAGS